MRLPTSGLAAILVTSLAGCTGVPTRVAASVPVPAGGTRTLRLEGPAPKDIAVELWNRGPGTVRFRSVDAAGGIHAEGSLDPGGGEFRVQSTTAVMLLELTADAAGATVAYTARARGALQIDVQQR